MQQAPAVHPSARQWKINPGRLSLESGVEGFSLLNLREWGASPNLLEHRLTILAEVCDSVLECVTASEPLYFGHVNYSDEFNLLLPTGNPIVDRIQARTYFCDPNTGEPRGYVLGATGDITVHPVGICHWPGYLDEPEKYRPPREQFRMRVLSSVYCSKGPVSYNNTASDERIAHLNWEKVEVHPDFEGIELTYPTGKFDDPDYAKRCGGVPLKALMADRNRAEDGPEAMAKVGQTRFDLIVSAGGPKRAFQSDEKSYVLGYWGASKLELLGPEGKRVGTAALHETDLLGIPPGHGFRITGTESGKRSALMWLRKDPER